MNVQIEKKSIRRNACFAYQYRLVVLFSFFYAHPFSLLFIDKDLPNRYPVDNHETNVVYPSTDMKYNSFP